MGMLGLPSKTPQEGPLVLWAICPSKRERVTLGPVGIADAVASASLTNAMWWDRWAGAAVKVVDSNDENAELLDDVTEEVRADFFRRFPDVKTMLAQERAARIRREPPIVAKVISVEFEEDKKR
jgi:hypothetical protein